MSNGKRVVEICVDRVKSALNAELAGAHRIELCQDLSVGGTTPSYGLIVSTMRKCQLPIAVMVRPRGGDFCYDAFEFSGMLDDIKMMKDLGVKEIVTGVLLPSGELDVDKMKIIIDAAKPMKVVLHRAFDMTKDLEKTLSQAKDLGITRILTGGGMQKASDGLDMLKCLLKQAGDVTIMPGSGINAENVTSFMEAGFTELHLSGKLAVDSKMEYRREGLSMGASSADLEYVIDEANIEKIEEVIAQCN